jgi:hypothetical protein
MSASSFPIYYDEDPIVDTVTFAITPIDAFSGMLVRAGVKAEVDGLPNRPIKNLSGHLVFINLPASPKYTGTVNAREAGYFWPEPFDFVPSATADKRRKVLLYPRPEFAYPPETTLIRGVVVLGTAPNAPAVANARIYTDVPSFETRSDTRGSFALALTLSTAMSHGGKATVKLTLEQGGKTRLFPNLEIIEAKPQSFNMPIDLNGGNNPILRT